jgi:hypothetical protein
MSFVNVVFKVLHPKPPRENIKNYVKKINFKLNFFYFRKNIVLLIINKLLINSLVLIIKFSEKQRVK